MLHKIKLNILFCDDVINGIKTFEVRKDDRNYQRGDFVIFTPVDDLGLRTKHPIDSRKYEITYVLHGWGIKEDCCVFAIKESEATNETEEELKKCPSCGADMRKGGDG